MLMRGVNCPSLSAFVYSVSSWNSTDFQYMSVVTVLCASLLPFVCTNKPLLLSAEDRYVKTL